MSDDVYYGPGGRKPKQHPQAVWDELERLRKTGPLVRGRVLREATPTSSPLHQTIFDWDNETAGHKYRLKQAGELLRVFWTTAADGTPVRALSNVVVDGVRCYYPTKLALKRKDLAEQLLKKAARDRTAYELRYQEMKELCSILETRRSGPRKGDDDRPTA